MRKTTEATEGAARGENRGMATLIIELLRAKLRFYINHSRTALNGSLEISPYWRFPVLGAKHKKDPFQIACICILLLTKKVEDATVLAAVSAGLISSLSSKYFPDLSSFSQSSGVSGCCLVLPLVHIYRSDDGSSCLCKASAQVGWGQCCPALLRFCCPFCP